MLPVFLKSDNFNFRARDKLAELLIDSSDVFVKNGIGNRIDGKENLSYFLSGSTRSAGTLSSLL